MLSSGGGSKHSAPAAPEPVGSLDDQISRAVAKAASEREQQTRAEAAENRLKELEARMEKAPVQIRDITKLFWGGE
jgi:septal ring factor EnvC (AmiA/AmiB activator)